MSISDKNNHLSEEDTKLRFITPALQNVGWESQQMRMEYTFTDGRVLIRGKKGERDKPKKADYVLFYKNRSSNIPLAIVEAKKISLPHSEGLQQAVNYANILDIPFCYSSNGEKFVEYDRITGKETELELAEFPSPQTLWERYLQGNNITPEQEKIITQPYSFKQGDKTPRYYQSIAINRTVEAVAKGQERILLVMATGTGKTFTAFHIIDRLLKSKVKKKILYLADRNILIDQTMQQDFKPFQKIMTKVEDKKLDSSYEIYMSLYHQLAGEEGKEPFRQFQPSFFDLIIVDECHRGSAKEESRWRTILDYFSSATQIGMTATPKYDDDVNTFDYFGKPIYTYSLKNGIEDGFLAPYRVIRPLLDIDHSWRPEKGLLDEQGNEVEDREYNTSDYDKNIILKDRTEKVAKRITQWLKENDRMAKTIVFCVGTQHADRMRQELGNQNADLKQKDSRYVMRITGDDDEGKRQLENFIREDESFPVIATTSKLLSTGVDTKMVKLIVLDNNISSMTEFKQIIGRGTRLREKDGKMFFTIMDFRGSTRLFADPDFDGDDVEIIDEEPCEICGQQPCKCEKQRGPVMNTPPTNGGGDDTTGEKQPIQVVGKGNVAVSILQEKVQYVDNHGKLITEKITDYSKRTILGKYGELSDFLQEWEEKDRRKNIEELLASVGVSLEIIRAEAGNPQNMDDFDLLCHIAYDKKPLTRRERAENVKKRNYINKYEGLAREVLSQLIDLYAEIGIEAIDDISVLRNSPFNKIGFNKILKAFGGKDNFEHILHELRHEILEAA